MNNREFTMAFVVVGVFIVFFSYFLFLSKVTDNPNMKNPLTEFQITACDSAERGNSCETKLPKLNLVTASDCCKYLHKCC